jgi:hypothetical protein
MLDYIVVLAAYSGFGIFCIKKTGGSCVPPAPVNLQCCCQQGWILADSRSSYWIPCVGTADITEKFEVP